MFVYEELLRKYGIYLDGELVKTFGKGEYQLAHNYFTNLIKDNLNSNIKLVDSDEDKAIEEYEAILCSICK